MSEFVPGGDQEYIAIIGMAGRFPDAPDIDDFWRNLRDGVESIRPFSDEELLAAGTAPALLANPNFVKVGTVLPEIEGFDASFFGYLPSDAALLDPQQRVFLECAWEALENAGYDPERYAGAIGVYGGVGVNTYLPNNLYANRPALERAGAFQTMIANDKDYLTTRVAYKLNLKGPAVTVQTACSTSLVAIHQACQSLLGYGCDIALAGGVGFQTPQVRGYLHQDGMIYSPDGHCRAFDARAAGTVVGGGAGIVVLKRLSDALADGDTIHAVVKGSASNNDGSSKVGYTAPSVDGQAEVIAMAQAVAGVDPATIGYIEAHGTGTHLGDPIEIAALTQAFRAGTDRVGYCAVGSVKTNIGHADAAAGVIGVIKTALALEHRQLPPSLHFERPNPNINFADSPFYVNAALADWPAQDAPRRAGISGFGIGGTNAHVVLEEAPEITADPPTRDWQVLPLAARSASALDRAAARLAAHLRAHPDIALADVAHTLQSGRRAFDHRRIVVARDPAAAAAALETTAPGSGFVGKRAAHNRAVAFMFTGQGAQYIGMGRDLYEREPVFRDAVDRCAALLLPHLGCDLRDLIYPPGTEAEAAAERLNGTAITQPALFTIEWALAQLWRSWGVEPAALIGHSIGEYVAACLARVFTLEDALAIVATRGRLMAGMPAGGMLAVPLPEEEVRPLLGDELAIAAINGPGVCVVAGPFAALDALAARLAARGVDGRRLQTSHAFHSAMMDPILDAFESEVRRVRLAAPQLPFISNVSGTWITAEEATDPSYWARHLRGTVRFADGLRTIGATADHVLLEVGPGRTLATLASRQGVGTEKFVGIPSLRHPAEEADDVATMLAALGRLWLVGAPVDWAPLHGAERRRRVPLPTYPFERQRCWIDPLPAAADGAAAPPARPASTTGETQMLHATPVTEATMPEPQTVAPPHRRGRILEALGAILSDLSGIPAEELDPTVSFMELGFDSLFLTQASHAIRTQLGAQVTFRQLLETTPTLDALAAYLDEALPAEAFQPEAPPAPAPVHPVAGTPAAVVAAPAAQPTAQPVALAVPGQVTATPGDASAIERIMAQQLQLMAQQLSVLQGGPVASSPAVPTATAVAVPTPLTAKGGAEPSASGSAPEAPKSFGPFRPLVKESGDSLTPQQQAHLDALIARYTARTAESKRLTDQHRPYLADPRGVSGFRAAWKEMVYPLTTTRSAGSRVWDVDGNEYIDITMGFGAYLLGHSPPSIAEALREQLERGIEIGSQAPQAGEVARLFCEITGHERAAFCSTGSEAVMTAIRVARAVTGRTRIALFEGAYHGNFDEVLVRPGRAGAALPIAPGIPRSVVGEALVLPYGAPESLEILRAHAHELAAVLVEPVQSRRPELQPAEFLRDLRQLTASAGTALIMDEMVTGFRADLRGAQGWFGVEADLATYGKIVGGGLPIGVLTGKAAYLDALDGGHWRFGDDSGPEANLTYFAGTMVKHPLALAASLAILRHLREEGPQLQERLNARTARMARTVNDELERLGAPLRIVHFGSLFNFRFPPDAKYAELLFYHLRERGIFVWGGRNLFLTTAHTDADLERIARAIVESVAALQGVGFLPGPPGGPNGHGGGLPIIARETAPSGGRTAVLAPARPAVATVPLTAGQREIWMATQMSEDAVCAYNESVVAHLRGELRVDALRDALQALVARHEALRLTFPNGERQEIADTVALDVPLIDLAHLPLAEREAGLAGIQATEAGEPFDLAHGPLLRARLVRLTPSHHTLILTTHHIVCDGWSLGVLLGELNPIYTARCRGVEPELPAAEPFGAYARSQAEPEAAARAAASEHYWLDLYAEAVPVLDLPTDRPRPTLKTYHAGQEVLTIEPALVQELRRLGGRHGSTLFTTLLAAYGALLYRSTGQDDLVVGIAAAGQAQHERGDTLVGHCVNMLPLHLRPRAGEPFGTFLTTVRGTVMDAFDHQDCSFGALVPRLPIARDPGRVPLVETTFNLDRATDDAPWEGLDVQVVGNAKRFFNFDLGFDIAQSGGELRLHCNYNTDLFDAATIRRLLGRYRTILEGIIAEPTRRLAALPVLGTGESAQLAAWNATAAPRPDGGTVIELVATQAARTPAAVAVEGAGERLTYAELESRANQLARHLRGLEAGPGALVALATDRSPAMVVGLLGILKAGAAYLPLDPDFPAERLAFMLADAAVPVLVTQRAVLDGLPPTDARIVCLDSDWPDIAREDAGPLDGVAAPADLAYVIYTSGSTGRPKGVMVEHGALANFLAAMAREPGLAADDVLLAVTTLSFDIAALELFLPLTVGARVVLADRATAADGARLAARLAACGATALQATPATWRLLLAAGWAGAPGLVALCGGEALPRELADALLPRVGALWNMYGPTETTIWSAVSRVVPGTGPVPVGLPIANTTFHLLDPQGQPVPVGITGELHIGGAGLARGYLNRPELTAERFIPDPFAADPGARLYKTGDLARRRPDGQLEFLGRLDHQVKIRGYRIELGEVEAALAAHPAVRQAVVVAREDAPGDQRLVAYLVAAGATPPAASELRPFLKAALPEYMVPAAFVALDTLPLTPNGKVDRKALPAPQAAPGDGASRAVAAPGDTLELQLVALWEGVLGVRPIGVDDNFFDLGGHSLLAVRLFGEIERIFGRALPLATLFRAPTVGQLAAILRQPGHAPSWSPLVLLSGGGEQPPLFLAHAIGGNVLNYRDLARELGGDRPVYGLQALGLDGQQAPLTRVEEMATRYLAEIRRIQPTGPYHLGGQCFGGMIALEMAQQLQSAGETVALLAMFDNEAPGYTKALPAGRRARITADWFARRARFHAHQLTEQSAGTWLPYLGARGVTVLRRGRSRVWGLAGRAYRHVGQALPESLRNVREAALLAQRDYVPRPYHGRPVLFVVNDQEEPVVPGSQYGWEGLATGGVEIIEVPGDHKTMLSEPHVSTLATRLRDCLAWAERAG